MVAISGRNGQDFIRLVGILHDFFLFRQGLVIVGEMWRNLAMLAMTWRNLTRFGHIYQNLTRLGGVLNDFGISHVWRNLAIFG